MSCDSTAFFLFLQLVLSYPAPGLSLIRQPRALPDGHAWATQDNSVWAMGQPSEADGKVVLPLAVIGLIDVDMNKASTGGRES